VVAEVQLAELAAPVEQAQNRLVLVAGLAEQVEPARVVLA
jgi:hypothetical protein